MTTVCSHLVTAPLRAQQLSLSRLESLCRGALLRHTEAGSVSLAELLSVLLSGLTPMS